MTMVATPPDHITADFAFEPPMLDSSATGYETGLKTPSYSHGISPTADHFAPGAFAFASFTGYPPSAFSSGSASGSGSGSTPAGGPSYTTSSADLASSSRDYRPSPNETRRPATAGGALQSRSPWGPLSSSRDKPETIDETTELFTNPYSVTNGELTKAMDTHFLANRRASDSHFTPSGLWSEPTDPSQLSSEMDHVPMASTPAHVNPFAFMTQPHPFMTPANPRPGALSYTNRPVTSDGIMHHNSIGGSVNVAIPRPTTAHVDPTQAYVMPVGSFNNASGVMPFRDARSLSFSGASPQQQQQQQQQQADQQPTQPGGSGSGEPLNTFPGNRDYTMGDKMFDDVKNNSDLTFVSLGGPAPKKRPRRRYDEIERLYSCGWQGCEKSYGTLNHLNAHVAMQKHGEKRLPIEFKDMRKAWRKKKREQQAAAANAQYMAQTQTWNPRPSYTSSDSDYDRRESTGSIYASDYSQRGSVIYPFGWDSRPSTASSVESTSDGRFGAVSAYAAGMINPSPALRRPSAPSHVPMPLQNMSFKDNTNTPTNGQTPSLSPYAMRPGSSGATYGGVGLPMTSPVPVGGQFAFQR